MACDPILVIDDNPVNSRLASLTLELAGYQVRVAGDAEEALATLESFSPRLILMDIQLPGMDGLELTRQLKAEARFSQTVILGITSYAMKGDEERVLEAGCDGYLPKPIDTRTFAGVIAEYIDRGPAASNSSRGPLGIGDQRPVTS